MERKDGMQRQGKLPRVKVGPATIHDIAREAGVSISTVSRVLNGTVPVAEETATRVWSAVQRLDYTPNAAAKRLASKRANAIGLLLTEISGAFFPPMLRGIENCVRQHGLDLLIFSTSHPSRPALPGSYPLGEHNTDGLLVFPGSLSEQDMGWFYRRGFPLVLLFHSAPDGLNIPSVVFENQTSTEKLIGHLSEVHHCRRIVFLRGPENHEDSLVREASYRAALERYHLPFDPELMETGAFNPQISSQAIQRILDRGIRFDAVFTNDDEAAAGVITTLSQRGLRVPEDVAVVGFDDTAMAPFMPVPMTTVHTPIEQAGYEAARQLIQLIQSGQAETQIVLPTDLVIRRSCGCNTLSPGGLL